MKKMGVVSDGRKSTAGRSKLRKCGDVIERVILKTTIDETPSLEN